MRFDKLKPARCGRGWADHGACTDQAEIAALRLRVLDRESRISVIHAKTVYLGRVWAPDKASAIDKAVEEFRIAPARRFQLIAEPVE